MQLSPRFLEKLQCSLLLLEETLLGGQCLPSLLSTCHSACYLTDTLPRLHEVLLNVQGEGFSQSYCMSLEPETTSGLRGQHSGDRHLREVGCVQGAGPEFIP